jgi:integrase
MTLRQVLREGSRRDPELDNRCDGNRRNTRLAIALTHKSIEALGADAKAYRVPDARCPGLAVRVAPSGLRTWDLAFRIRGSGKYRRLSLGRFPEISLEAARDRANELTREARAGRDVIGETVAAKAAADSRLTVNGLIDCYLRRRVHGRLRTAKEIEKILRRALAPIKDRYADEIRRRDMRQILDAVADRGVLREAEKRRQTVGAMFRWALGQDLIEIDPINGLQSYGMGERRDRVLSADELRILWHWLDTSGFPYRDVLKLQIALGARCGEIAGMRVDEIDQKQWLWTLPEERSKNKRPRTTPLIGIARAIVAGRLDSAGSGPLFLSENGGLPLRTAHVAAVLVKRKKKLPVEDFTSHDLRRTFATQLAEMGVALDLIAALVGHETGKDQRTLIRHYVRAQRFDAKRAVLTAWDEWLSQRVLCTHGAPQGVTRPPRLMGRSRHTRKSGRTGAS